MPQEVCCKNWKHLFDYIENTPNLQGGYSGRQAVEKTIDGLVNTPKYLIVDPTKNKEFYPVKESHLRDERYWHSLEFTNKLFENVATVIGGYRPLFQAGIISGYNCLLELFPAHFQLLRILSPGMMTKIIGRINKKFNKTRSPKMVEYSSSETIIKMNVYPDYIDSFSEHICDWNAGIYMGMAKFTGVQNISVEEIECKKKGGDDCVFKITWKYLSTFKRFLIFCHSILDPGYIVSRDLDNLLLNDLSVRQEGIIENRTNELETAYNKLQELDKIKSNFFANVSHEIRTPLTLIISPIESFLQGDYRKGLNEDFFKSIHRNSIRLLELINSMLDFSKIEAGRMSMKVAKVDIVKTIENWLGTVRSACEFRNISISHISLNKVVEIYIDLDKFEKIVMNLLSNSLKFTNPGGQIIVRIKDDDKNCYLELEDTGSGILREKLDSIFDRFSQIDSKTTQRFEGTGIGLSLVKEFVEMHEGKISVESKHIDEYPQDHGTIFLMTIPKGRKHFEEKRGVVFSENNELEKSISDSWLVRMHGMFDLEKNHNFNKAHNKNDVSSRSSEYDILIVDDNKELRNFLRLLLSEKYNTHIAVNGKDGLNKAREVKPDLIISDVMMPIMNGYEMTQRIKEDEELKRIPVMMITAKADLANKIEGLEYGADDYLAKPFNSKELLTRVKSLLKINMLQKELICLNENLQEKVNEQLEIIKKGNQLKDYLPPQLVDSILSGEKIVSFDTERKKLTVFFSDIKGFTSATDALEAEDLSSILNEYFTEMTKIAHKYGGTIDKFMGDGMMIFFGAPEATNDKDHALRCLKMAIAMQKKMKTLQKGWFNAGIEIPLTIRIGINTGTATVGNFGAKDRLSYTAIGGQVNIAYRLEGLCEPGGILISHATWALVKDEIKYSNEKKVSVKGIRRELLVYEVIFDNP